VAKGRITSWIVGRSIECLFGSIILLVVLGGNSAHSRFINDILENSVFVFFFFVLSGYLITSLCMAMIVNVNILRRVSLNIGLFVLHATGFLYLAEVNFNSSALIILFGVFAVGLSTVLGEAVRGFLPMTAEGGDRRQRQRRGDGL
jgi:peptidoglycan/LPS O-acetylase OafA/YrhL